MTSVFSNVQTAPSIEVFALTEQFKKDSNPNKVNLTVGAYRTEECKPWVLPVVKTVEAQLAADDTLDKEYLPVTGLPDFCASAVAVCFGEGHPMVLSQRADGIQSLGGTGALRLGYDFLRCILGRDTIYVSKPTWGNHKGIAQQCGYPNVREYRYWLASGRCLDEQGMLEDLTAAPEGSVIVLHGVAHNPTGCDPTPEQWEKILAVIKQRNLFPLIDLAYQGFASGDLDRDGRVPRLFADHNMEFFVAQSFSKNFGLYNERVGNLAIVTQSAEITGRVKSQVRNIIRKTWSNPPSHGARVVATVLRNPALAAEWRENIKRMAERIVLMRQMLFQKLRALGTPGNWQHITDQIGMFSYTGLSAAQAEYLRTNYAIYIMSDGRINMSGLTSKTVDRVAQAMHEAVTKCSA
ncbi:hypothetical protein BOX15_Mlig013047g3 [Macrostomum lignano]|uniref:Uncharacterized protein n=2 Tax=Macrostomum lignano TaxID=282301 RepID=A0A267GL87_9PLAT|nr:hypothetical protein BOX15_Mlig013047g1 [Macrostomum lignano]PAA92406.1 hypothetical protein BOX15_Mlig013047g3 [Macrostomum lignano]